MTERCSGGSSRHGSPTASTSPKAFRLSWEEWGTSQRDELPCAARQSRPVCRPAGNRSSSKAREATTKGPRRLLAPQRGERMCDVKPRTLFVGALGGGDRQGLVFERTRSVARRRVNHESGFACGNATAVHRIRVSCSIEVLKNCTGRR